MRSRLLIGLLVAGVLASAAWGCGDDSEGSTPTSPTTPRPTTPANRAPTASGSIPSQTLTAGESTTVDVARYFSDPDGDALTYGATSSAASVATVSVSASAVNVDAQDAGQAQVTVTARDPGNLNATQQFSVTVEARGPMPGGDCVVGLVLSPGQFCTVDVPGISVGSNRFEVMSDGRGCYGGSLCAGNGLNLSGFRAARISGTDNWRIEALP